MKRREFIEVTGKSAFAAMSCCAFCSSAKSEDKDADDQGSDKIPELLAYCGIDCRICMGCPKGCRGEKVKDSAQKCKMRLCARRRKIESCGLCKEYSCKMLDQHLKPKKKWAQNARKELERIHAKHAEGKKGKDVGAQT